MQVTFQKSFEDYQAFRRAMKSWLFATKVWFLLLILLGPLAALFFNPSFYRSFKALGWKTMLQIHGTSLLVQILIVAVLGILSSAMERGRIQKSPRLATPTIIVAGDENIEQIVGKRRDAFVWSCVQSVLETDAHFFVLVARQSDLIIPKRAFDSPAQCAEFGALIKRKWAQHHSDAAPIASAK